MQNRLIAAGKENQPALVAERWRHREYSSSMTMSAIFSPLAQVLEGIGEVVCAKSGEEALRFLLKDQFAVILLDVLMPGLDGYETAALIRKREQSKRTRRLSS